MPIENHPAAIATGCLASTVCNTTSSIHLDSSWQPCVQTKSYTTSSRLSKPALSCMSLLGSETMRRLSLHCYHSCNLCTAMSYAKTVLTAAIGMTRACRKLLECG